MPGEPDRWRDLRHRRRRQRLDRRLDRPSDRPATPRPSSSARRATAGYGARARTSVLGASPLASCCSSATRTRRRARRDRTACRGALDAHPGAAVAGPMLVEPDGSVYPSGGSFPGLGDALGHGFVGLFWRSNPWTRRYRLLGDDQHRSARGGLGLGRRLSRAARRVRCGRRVRRGVFHVRRGRRPVLAAAPRRMGGALRARRVVSPMSRAVPPRAAPTGCSSPTTGRSSVSRGRSTEGRERLLLPLVALALGARLVLSASERYAGGLRAASGARQTAPSPRSAARRSPLWRDAGGRMQGPAGTRVVARAQGFHRPKGRALPRRSAAAAATVAHALRAGTRSCWRSASSGSALIVFSRHERQQAAATTTTTTTTTPANTTPPLLTDHWQVAVSVDICGKVVNLPASANQTLGHHHDGNGVVDIQPARAGSKAVEFEGDERHAGQVPHARRA